jgi:RimJ/RimL family protein N-acetyltransferase
LFIVVRLAPLTPLEFQHYRAAVVEKLAQAGVSAGAWGDKASHAVAEASIAALLPLGIATPGHQLVNVVAEATAECVGVLWFRVEDMWADKEVTILDLEIEERHRRSGYARGVVEAVIQIGREMGATRIRANVFANNTASTAVVRELGFYPVSTSWNLAISHP